MRRDGLGGRLDLGRCSGKQIVTRVSALPGSGQLRGKNMRKKILLASTAVVAVFAFAVTAQAGGRTAKDSRDAEIQELKARLDRLEQQQADDQRAAQDAAVQEQSR